MHGPDDDMTRLVALLDQRAASSSRVRGVLVTGLPGSGRSTVLRRLGEQHTGTTWVTAGRDPVPGVSALAGLLAEIPTAATGHRRTLERVAWARDRPGDIDRAADGLAELARGVGARAPVLWTIDDLDDVDHRTRTVLSALLRRRPVAPLLVAATAPPTVTSWSGRRLDVPPTPEREIRRLLRAGDRIHPAVLDQLTTVCDANPGAAARLGATLDPTHKAGAALLPTPLPLPPTLVAHAAKELRSPGEDRDRLLSAAADARANGPVSRAEIRPRWLAHAALAAADPAELRRAHRRMAERCHARADRLVHLALAADEPDDSLAAAVAELAGDAVDHGDVVEAIRLGQIAYPTAASDELRTSIAFDTATAAVLAGQPRSMREWAARAGSDDRSVALAGVARRGQGPELERVRLRQAMSEANTRTPMEFAALAAQYLRLALFEALDGVTDDLDLVETELARVRPSSDPDADAIAVRTVRSSIGIVRTLATGVRPDDALVAATGPMAARLQEVPDRPRLDVADTPTRGALYLAIVALAEERWADADRLLSAVVDVEGRSGWDGLHADSLGWLAELRWRQGRWEEIAADVERAVASTAAGDAYGAMLRAVHARSLGLGGRAPDIDAFGTVTGGSGVAEAVAQHGLGLAALGARDLDAARARLEATAAIVDGRVDHPGLITWRADLVEILAAMGEIRHATAELRRLDGHAERDPVGLQVVPRLRARAALHQNRRSLDVLEDALAVPGASPFERARTALELARQVRSEDVERSRRYATDAAALFDRCGAGTFARQARQLAGRIDDRLIATSVLSPRENDVAQRIIAGRTNAEIAEEWGRSEKTVEFHLANIFRTLELSNRAQLATLLAPTEY